MVRPSQQDVAPYEKGLSGEGIDESRKDETCLQLKMKKHFIKTRKISQKRGLGTRGLRIVTEAINLLKAGHPSR